MPTNKPMVREDANDVVFKAPEGKWKAVVQARRRCLACSCFCLRKAEPYQQCSTSGVQQVQPARCMYPTRFRTVCMQCAAALRSPGQLRLRSHCKMVLCWLELV